jgi:hypothetical protein
LDGSEDAFDVATFAQRDALVPLPLKWRALIALPTGAAEAVGCGRASMAPIDLPLPLESRVTTELPTFGGEVVG